MKEHIYYLAVKILCLLRKSCVNKSYDHRNSQKIWNTRYILRILLSENLSRVRYSVFDSCGDGWLGLFFLDFPQKFSLLACSITVNQSTENVLGKRKDVKTVPDFILYCILCHANIGERMTYLEASIITMFDVIHCPLDSLWSY